MQKDDVRDLLVYASACWPGKFVMPANETELKLTELVWMDHLGALDPELVRAAMVRWQETWPPHPRQLYDEAMAQLALERGASPAPSLDEAWLEFKDCYQSRGPWSHPAVEAAAKALGCQVFGNSQESEEMAWRAHFFKLYEASLRRRDDADAPLPPILAQRMSGVLRRLDDEFTPDELGEGDA